MADNKKMTAEDVILDLDARIGLIRAKAAMVCGYELEGDNNCADIIEQCKEAQETVKKYREGQA